MKPKEQELKEGMKKCEEMIKQLEVNSTTTQNQINELFKKIRAKLDEKEQELLDQLAEIEKYKKKELEFQKEELKFGAESIIGSCEMIEHSLSLSSHNDNILLLSMDKPYHSRLNYLINNDWRIEPECHSLMEFSICEKEEELIYATISNVGILYSNEISADKCLISRDEDVPIFKDEEFGFEIVSYSKEGNEMEKGGNGKKFKIQIERDSTNEKNEINKNHEWEIKDLNNGKYEIKIKMKNDGKYSIFVQYNGLDIISSPFKIQVFPELKPRIYSEINDPKLTFGSIGNKNGQFSNPFGVVTNSKGNILVSDFSNSRIQTFNFEGKYLSTLGSQGKGNGQFLHSLGLAINSKGNILVCDYRNHRVQIFDSKGVFISTFGSQGNANGQFSRPEAVCVDKNDNIYVCDNENHRVQIFNSEGTFMLKFGSEGNENGQFNNPCGIGINSKGNVIIGDWGNHRIQIFNSKREFLSTFGSKGNGNGQFQNPGGLCIDSNDNILVCDYNNNRIQVFGPQGEYITQFGMNHPTAITIDSKTQNIIVCGLDHQVSIF